MKELFTATLLILLFACKKVELKDDKAILAGKWVWKYSVEYKNALINDTIQASAHDHQYKIEMLEKGKIILDDNNDRKKYRIIMRQYEYNSSADRYEGNMWYKNLKKHRMIFNVYDRAVDSLEVYGSSFPLDTTSENGNTYSHVSYFVRE